MNPVVLYFASGESLYPGAALLLLALVISPFLKRKGPLVTRNAFVWIALSMIVMASPPVSWLIAFIFLLAFCCWFLAWNAASMRKSRPVSALLLATLVVLLPTLELRHRALTEVSGTHSDHLVVIGDSVSSGIDPRIAPWPALMQEMTGVRVVNLARPGAYVKDGLEMANKLGPADHLVLIEIGGNDLIIGTEANRFEQALDALLRKVAAPGRTIVMFELPLLPWRIAFGQAQRRLAGKYGVFLIPKRLFTYVIRGPSATSDGLHLLPEGERRMATLVASVLSSVMKPGAPSPKS